MTYRNWPVSQPAQVSDSERMPLTLRASNIRLGYACINNQLREYDIFTSRGMILKTFAQKGVEFAKEIIMENIDDLLKILIFNEAHGIRFFRISSCVFPHLGNPQAAYSYDIGFAKKALKRVGEYAKTHGHRLTSHPGQFCIISTSDEEIFKRTIVDLQNHVDLFKAMGYTPADGTVLIIHGGGTYGDKATTLKRWRENFLKLPVDIQPYICLENDENNYGIMDLLPVCEELNIPFCLDIFHNSVSKDRVDITKSLMKRIFNTWKRRSMTPKMHVSEQQPGLRRGAHSKTINRLPLYLFRLPSMFDTDLDIMLEVKDKEVSVFKIYHRYFNIRMDSTGRVDYVLKKRIVEKLKLQKKK